MSDESDAIAGSTEQPKRRGRRTGSKNVATAGAAPCDVKALDSIIRTLAPFSTAERARIISTVQHWLDSDPRAEGCNLHSDLGNGAGRIASGERSVDLPTV